MLMKCFRTYVSHMQKVELGPGEKKKDFRPRLGYSNPIFHSDMPANSWTFDALDATSAFFLLHLRT